MELKLVKLTDTYKEQLLEMMDEWHCAREKIVPYAIQKTDWHNFDNYINEIERNRKYKY